MTTLLNAETSQSEFCKIMSDMERVYIAEQKRLNEIAPRCHFRPMFLDSDDCEEWWECSVCGHTKRCGAGVLA
jgi:hypothetical protein